MRYASIKAAILIAGGILGLCLYFAACDDNPVEPEPPKDYSVYFYDAIHNEGNWYFAYHPATNQLDSVWLPYESAPVISADGRKMYVRNQVDDVIDVLELDSFTVVTQLPYGAPISVSPDGQMIAVWGEGLYILRTSDYSEVFYDTTTLGAGGGVFSSNSHRFYCAPSAGGVYILDLSIPSFPVTRITPPFGAVGDLAPSLDEFKLFLYLQRPQVLKYGAFAVYDLTTDSLIFSDTLRPGYGELESTPDGRYVFYTNPGTMLTPPGPPWVTVYDVEKNEIHTRISTAGILDEPYEYGMPLGEICITPDGRWLVALPAKSFPFVFTVHIYTMTIAKYLRFRQRFMEGLACQNAP